MACDTCSGTMQSLGGIDGEPCGIFWCPRCGSLRWNEGDHGFAAPDLVARCRSFGSALSITPVYSDMWRTLGIEEAIYPPECR